MIYIVSTILQNKIKKNQKILFFEQYNSLNNGHHSFATDSILMNLAKFLLDSLYFYQNLSTFNFGLTNFDKNKGSGNRFSSKVVK